MTAALLHLLISYMPHSGDLCHFMRSLYAGTAFPAWYPGTEVSPRGIYLHEYFLSSLHTKKKQYVVGDVAETWEIMNSS